MNFLTDIKAAELVSSLSEFTPETAMFPALCESRKFRSGEKEVLVELSQYYINVSVSGESIGVINNTSPAFDELRGLVKYERDTSGVLEAIVGADPEPPRRKSMPPARFKLALGQSARLAIRQAVAYEGVDAGDLTKKAILGDWWDILNDPTLTAVSVEDPDTIAALGYLVSIDVLTEAERDDILLGVPA